MVTFADSALEEVQTDSLLVGVALNLTVFEIETILQDANLGDLIVEKVWPEFGIALVKVSEPSASPIVAAGADTMQRVEAYRQALEQVSAVHYVEYNSLISIAPSSNSSTNEYLSGITQLPSRIPSDNANNQGVAVALIDSGFGTGEVDSSDYPLWENLAEINGMEHIDNDDNGFIDDFHGYDWVDNNNVMNDELGHGTEVGTALLDFAEQVAGNSNDVRLMPLRILREDGKGKISDLVDALAYTLHKNVRIAHMNLVLSCSFLVIERAMEIAYSQGLLMVVADGNPNPYPCFRIPFPSPETTVAANGNLSHLSQPAAYSTALSVLSVLRDDETTSCHTDPQIDVAIFTESDEQTSAMSAAPRVTAIIALALGQNPELSLDEIRAAIREEGGCEDGTLDGIRTLEIEELVTILSVPTAFPDADEPEAHQFYLPLIAK